MGNKASFCNGSTAALCLFLLLLFKVSFHAAPAKFIAAPERVDMVHDSKRNMLYITSGTRILRYDLGIEAFRTPVEVGGNLRGIDISPDGDFLAVADATSSSQSWIHVVDLKDLSSSKLLFENGGSESGTFTVAFAFDNTVLVSGLYPGSGWVQLRRCDIVSKTAQPLGSIRQNTMLRASGDRRFIGLAEANISSGPVRLYDTTTQTLEAGTGHGWFNYEIAVNRNGTQFASPTYGGMFVYDRDYRLTHTIGVYAGASPVGLAYHPTKDAIFTAWAGSSEVRVHNTTSFQELGRFNASGSFEHPGNASFQPGRMRLSGDGSLVFVTVANGISWFAHELDIPSYVRVVISGTPAQPGIPTPNGYGTNFFLLNSQATNSVPENAELDGVRFRNNGFSALGVQVLSTGSSNRVVFNATTNGTIQWNWTPTHYLLTARSVGSGTVSLTNGWIEADQSALVHATPAEGWRFVRWIGQVPEAKATDNPISIEMDQPRVMSALFSNSDSASGLMGDWPTFGRDTMHSGYFAGGLGTNRFAHRWTAMLSNALNQVVVAENKVFITPYIRFNEAHVMALSESSGQLLWKKAFPPNPNSMNPPTYADGAVYVQRGNHGGDTYLIKLDAKTGNTVWKSPFGAQWERYFAPVVADGKVWINGGSYGGMYGFDAGTGSQLFFQGLAQYDEWTPAYWDGRLFSFIAGVFTEHNPLSGANVWSANLGWDWRGWSMNRTISISDGRAFVVNNPGLAAFDLTTRKLLWETSGSFQGTPATANGAVYVNEGGTQIAILSAATGQSLGSFPFEGTIMNQPIVTDDVLIIATSARTDVFDLITKSLVQSIPFGGQVTLANGVLFIAGTEGRLEAWTTTVDKTLTVDHNGFALGDPSPYGYGINKVPAGQLTTNRVATTVDQSGNRYVLDSLNLSGLGSSLQNGNVVFRMTNDAVLTYNWRLTDYQLTTFVSGRGSVNITNQWLPVGSSVQLVATPSEGMRFVRWSGAISESDATSNPLTLQMDDPQRITAVFLPANSPDDISSEWPTLGNNMGHSSHVPGVLGTNQFHWRWTSALGGSLQQAAVGGHRVFIIPAVRFAPAIVEAVSPYSGQLFWARTFPPEPNNVSPPTYASGGLFFQRSNHGSDSQVFRLDPATGDVVWRSPYAAQWPTHLAPVVSDNSVFVHGGYYGGLYGYNATTGQEKFFKSLEQVDGWTPAYWNGRLFTCASGNFREHNTTNGEPIWSLSVFSDSWSSTATPVISDGIGFVSSSGQLVAVDLESKAVAWRKTGSFGRLPAIANGNIYITEGSTLAKYSFDTGQLLGSWNVPNSGTIYQPIVTDDSVIVSTDSATYVFDLVTDSLRQTIPAGGAPSLADRVLYLAGNTGNLQAWSLDPEVILVVRSDSGQIGKPYPFTYGANYVPKNKEFEATAIPTAESNAVTRVFISGWTGTGDIQSGSGPVVRLKLTNESTLTWLWATQHLVSVSINGNGTTSVTNSWVYAGSNLTVQASPAAFNLFVGWSGSVTSTNPVLNLSVTGPLNLIATFLPETVTNGVAKAWLDQYGLPTTDAAALGDSDSDGLTTWREFQLGLNPVNPDTDSDSYQDGLEIAWLSNATDPLSVPEAQLEITSSDSQATQVSPFGLGTFSLRLFSTNTLSAQFYSGGNSGTRYVPLGWTGSGSIPASGNTNELSFVLSTNSRIHWLWRKEHRLTVSTNFLLRDPSSNKTAVASFGDNAPTNAAFGASVSVFGDWAVIGAPLASSNVSTNRRGAIYLFQKTTAGWVYRRSFTPPDIETTAYGGAVAISEKWLAVTGVRSGRLQVTIYRKVIAFGETEENWNYERTPFLTNYEVQSINEVSLAWNSTALFIGIPSERGQTVSPDGVVLVMPSPPFAGGSWNVSAVLRPATSNLREEFGASLAASDSWLVVGAPNATGPDQNHMGAAYLYRLNPIIMTARITPTNAAPFSRFGASIATRGSLALIGAPEDDAGGAAFLYDLGTTVPSYRAKIRSTTSRPFQAFGGSVALDEGLALVGAPEGDSATSFGGTVQLFSTLQAQPEFTGSLVSASPVSEGWFGYSVASHDGTVIAGAPFESNGRAHLYALVESLKSPPVELWRTAQSQLDIPAAPESLVYGGRTYAFSGWELDGRLLVATNGQWINPPTIEVTGPQTLVARYTTDLSSTLLAIKFEVLPSKGASVLRFHATANTSYDLLSIDGLGKTNWMPIMHFNSAPADRTIQYTNTFSNNQAEFFRLRRAE